MKTTQIDGRFTEDERNLLAYISGHYDLWAAGADDDWGKLMNDALTDVLIGASDEATTVRTLANADDALVLATQAKVQRLTEGDIRELIQHLDNN